jgi:hypothetical protein
MRLLAVLLICQLVLLCSSGQGQVANSRLNSERRTEADLKNPENGDISTSVTESILSRIDEHIVQKMEHAWRAAGGGVDNKEAVLLLFRMDDGSIQARPGGLTNEQKSFTFKWFPSAIAILHTHPNSVDPQPSRPDRQLANKLGVSIFTLTVRGMYLYDPRTRKVTQIKRGLDWLELSKWKSTSKLD